MTLLLLQYRVSQTVASTLSLQCTTVFQTRVVFQTTVLDLVGDNLAEEDGLDPLNGWKGISGYSKDYIFFPELSIHPSSHLVRNQLVGAVREHHLGLNFLAPLHLTDFKVLRSDHIFTDHGSSFLYNARKRPWLNSTYFMNPRRKIAGNYADAYALGNVFTPARPVYNLEGPGGCTPGSCDLCNPQLCKHGAL